VDHESAHTILFGARKHPPKLLLLHSAPIVLQVAATVFTNGATVLQVA
jgi:hypothetical protein